jgi:hypothetical protein
VTKVKDYCSDDNGRITIVSYPLGASRRGRFCPTRKTGDRRDGTHVHAPAVVLEVLDVLPSMQFQFEAKIPMVINDPGNFFLIGTLQCFTGDTDRAPIYRYDVGNALKPDRGSVSRRRHAWHG